MRACFAFITRTSIGNCGYRCYTGRITPACSCCRRLSGCCLCTDSLQVCRFTCTGISRTIFATATSNRYTSELDARGEAKIVARARGEAAAFLALQQSVEIQGELYKFEAQHRAIRENLREDDAPL